MPKAYRRILDRGLAKRTIAKGEKPKADELVSLTGGRDRRKRPEVVIFNGKRIRTPLIPIKGRAS